MRKLDRRWLLLSLAVAAAAAMAARLLGWWDPHADIRVFIPEELARYRGGPRDPGLYLALLGRVFDVSSGRRHYEPGAHYSGFAGISEAAHALFCSDAARQPPWRRSFIHSPPRLIGPVLGGWAQHPSCLCVTRAIKARFAGLCHPLSFPVLCMSRVRETLPPPLVFPCYSLSVALGVLLLCQTAWFSEPEIHELCEARFQLELQLLHVLFKISLLMTVFVELKLLCFFLFPFISHLSSLFYSSHLLINPNLK